MEAIEEVYSAPRPEDKHTASVDPLNTSWITEYIQNHEDYSDFYKEDVESIELTLVYINTENEIFSVKREKHLIHKNKIPNPELIFLIDKFKMNHFKLLSLLKFNFHIEPEILIQDKFNSDDYLSQLQVTDDVNWEPTINILNDLNTLYFIYKEIPKETVPEHSQNASAPATNKRKTRKNRIFLKLNEEFDTQTTKNRKHGKHRKTLRKRV